MINNENFKIKQIPILNPLSNEYINWWKAEKRKCIEGMWSGGKYMPGPLYFYINFWHIKANKNVGSKQKILAKPFLRDIEWEKAYIYIEAKGFSGFSDDKDVTCLRDFKDRGYGWLDTKTNLPVRLENELEGFEYDKDSRYKKLNYIPARSYLRTIHPRNLGKPLYLNSARNIIDIECRDSGKSYMASSIVGHNFLFDGATDYDEYLEGRRTGSLLSSETLVGAIDAFYSKGLIDKVQLGFDNLEGGTTFGGEYYPPPLKQYYEGSFAPGKFIQAKKEIKVKNSWVVKGSKSLIHHRTFADNELAGNGTRPSFVVLEEVGFMNNLLPALGALKECTYSSGEKMGVILMTGTGGAMESGATEAAKEVFYNPDDYECLSFPDLWENKGNIGYFVPKYMALDQYKDTEGITDVPKAQAWWERQYEKAMNANDRKVLNKFLENSPGRPSDAFLISSGNILPIADLKQQLADLETKQEYKAIGKKGELVINEKGKIEFVYDANNRLKEAKFPIKPENDNTGCVIIYEFPEEENPPYFKYIAGTDPYAQDKSTGDSIGSTYIYKRSSVSGTGDIIVAEYCGRPNSMKEHNEIVRRLLMYYNAVDLYENMHVNLKEYFENKKCLHLLADTPRFVKATTNTKVQRMKGLHRTKDIGLELDLYLRDWLLETNPNGKLNLQNIYSKQLLIELIAYNTEDNFDRVIALELVIAYKIELTKQAVAERKKAATSSFFTRKLFTNG